jgi:hypothetical protein
MNEACAELLRRWRVARLGRRPVLVTVGASTHSMAERPVVRMEIGVRRFSEPLRAKANKECASALPDRGRTVEERAYMADRNIHEGLRPRRKWRMSTCSNRLRVVGRVRVQIAGSQPTLSAAVASGRLSLRSQASTRAPSPAAPTSRVSALGLVIRALYSC